MLSVLKEAQTRRQGATPPISDTHGNHLWARCDPQLKVHNFIKITMET